MSSQISVRPLDVRLTSIWMLQPDYTSFRRALEDKGYTLRDEARGSMVKIATKGSIEVFSNIERRTVGVSSETSTKDLRDTYEDFKQIYRELGIEESNFMIHEFIGRFSATSTKSPMDVIKRLTIGGDVMRKIGSIMEVELVPIGLRLTTKDGIPTTSEWLALDIDPLYVSANKKYLLRVVYRGELADVLKFVKTIERRLKKIIEKLEGVS